jgi:selenocysteine lyase/cysteine desulfurase
LTDLRHPSGAPLVRVYGPPGMDARGGTIAFNVLAPSGLLLDYRRVEAEANRWLISLRSGCFCNPGASEAALGLHSNVLEPLFATGRPSADALARRHAFGAVRVSLGIATTPADLARFIEFLRRFASAPAHH